LHTPPLEHHRCTLGIFAKAPVPGQVKTRLCPPLSPEQACDFYALSLDETIRLALRGPWCSVLFYSGAPDYFRRHYPQLHLAPQQGDDLGERMENALQELLAGGADCAALIGSDCPDLPAELIDQAFTVLQTEPAVIAPSHDGGYVLIGENRHHRELFHDICWSSPQVLTSTRERANHHGITLHEISPWEDVDDEDSLRRLMQRSPDSPCARLARKLLT